MDANTSYITPPLNRVTSGSAVADYTVLMLPAQGID